MPGPFSTGLARAGGGGGGDEPISLVSPRLRMPETTPPLDLMPYWPEQQQIQAAKTVYENQQETPLWARLLSLPSNILGREGITRGIKQAAEGYNQNGITGAITGAVGGFFSGEWDEATHAFGLLPGAHETHFSDIRKAFGQSDVDGGIGNFAINFIGDVMLDPVMYLSPLGFMTKGAQATKFPGATLAEQVGKLTDATGNAIRGGLVFRLPILQDTGIDVMKSAGEALAKLPLPYFDRFKSMNVQFAKAMDETFGFLRTAPVIGPLLQRFGAMPIQDPEKAGLLRKNWTLSVEQAGAYQRGLEQTLLKLPEGIKTLAYGDKDAQLFLMDLVDTGLAKVDNDGLVADAFKRLPDIIKQREFRAEWKSNDKLRELWKAASGDDLAATQATRKLYDTYDYWLPKSWLDRAGLTPRVVDLPAPYETLAEGATKELSGLPGALTPSEIDRGISSTIGASTGGTGQAAFFAKQAEARMARYGKFWDQIKDGTIAKDDLNAFLDIHSEVMSKVRDTELASGILNSTLEPYMPRVRNPALKALLDEQQGRMLGRFKFGEGFSFAKERKLTEMSAAEANQFLMDIGSNVTGFRGAGESVDAFKDELATHGPWAVVNKIFPQSFIQKKIMKVDEELGSFFMTNPVLADYWRINRSAKALLTHDFWTSLYAEGSPAIWDEARMADPVATMDLIKSAQQAQKPLFLISEKGGMPKLQDVGMPMTDAIGKDLRLRVGIQQDAISKELDLQLADGSTTFDKRLGDLKGLLKIGDKSDLSWTADTPYAEAMLKRQISERLGHMDDLKGLRGELADAKQALTDRWGELRADRAATFDILDRDLASLQDMGARQAAKLSMLAESPPDWKILDGWNAEVSARSDALKEAIEKIAARKASYAQVLLGKPEQDFYDTISGLTDRIAEKAGQMSRAQAEEMSLRAAIRGTADNLQTARNEVLAGREATIGAQREAANVAAARLKASISPEMVSNEAKLWYRFRNEGKLAWDEIGPDAQARMLKSGGTARLVAVDPELMAAAQKFHSMMTAPDPLKGNWFIDALDGIRSWFSTMTVIHPAMFQTRMRDFLGGAWSGAQAGYLTHEWGDAVRVSNAVGKADRAGADATAALDGISWTRDADGAVLNGADFMQAGQRMGSLGIGTLRDNLLDNMSESAKFTPEGTGKKIMDTALGFFGLKKPSENPVIRLGQKFARWGDDTVRSEIALAAWKKNPGWSIEDAFREANHWTYGTGQPITSFERYIGRRFFPFMGFIKWAVSRSAEQWLTKPSTLAWLPKVRDNAYKATGLDPQNVAPIMPQFINDNLGIPVANTPDGPKFYLFGSFMPVGNLIDVANAVSGIFSKNPIEGLRYISQNMHPALKAIGETTFNRDFWQGREIKQYPGETADFLGVTMDKDVRHFVKTFFRGLSTLDRLNVFNAAEMNVAVDAVQRQGVLGQRQELPLMERFLTSAFGPIAPSAYMVDAEEELRRKRNLDAQELNDRKSQLRKAVEDGKTANVDALRSVIADDLASIEARQASEAAFNFNPARTRKIRLVRP